MAEKITRENLVKKVTEALDTLKVQPDDIVAYIAVDRVMYLLEKFLAQED